ncbi:MAG: hypothetical protein AAF802_08445 [Planctomycetota bacterium]
MMKGRSNTEVLQCAATLTKFDIDSFACEMKSDDIERVEKYTFENCQATGIQKALIFGGLLELHASAVFEEDDPAKSKAMYERLGIGRSSAYEYRAIWRRFGPKLVADPAIARQFVTESLKILSRTHVPDSVIEMAIERARGGERISARLAMTLQDSRLAQRDDDSASQSMYPENRSENVPKGRKKGVWQFPGQAVRIILKPAVDAGFQNTAQVIQDLRDAIEQLMVDQAGNLADASQTGVPSSV